MSGRRTAVTLRTFRIAVLSVAGLGASCCNADRSSLIFEGKLGEHCYDCEECKHDLAAPCICQTCTEFAYDAATKQLLQCSASSLWTQKASCPGGVSVSCDGLNYAVRCLDSSGNPVAWQD